MVDGYRNVAFFGDSKVTFDTLKKCWNEDQRGRNQASVTYCEDIKRLANEELGFKFDVVPREVTQVAAALARTARVLKSNYVIIWIPNV